MKFFKIKRIQCSSKYKGPVSVWYDVCFKHLICANYTILPSVGQMVLNARSSCTKVELGEQFMIGSHLLTANYTFYDGKSLYYMICQTRLLLIQMGS